MVQKSLTKKLFRVYARTNIQSWSPSLATEAWAFLQKYSHIDREYIALRNTPKYQTLSSNSFLLWNVSRLHLFTQEKESPRRSGEFRSVCKRQRNPLWHFLTEDWHLSEYLTLPGIFISAADWIVMAPFSVSRFYNCYKMLFFPSLNRWPFTTKSFIWCWGKSNPTNQWNIQTPLNIYIEC